MENITKAVYIVAGVLIGILILTAFIFVFRKGGQMLENIDNSKTSEAIAEYNSKLIIYNRLGTDDNYNTIFDAITAWNLAYDINEENFYDEKNSLEIQIVVEGNIYTLTFENPYKKGYATDTIKLTELIKNYGQTIPNTYEYEYKFSGQTIIDEKTGRIIKIIFTHVL